MKNIIEIENLSKCYGDFTAVNHISFQVKKGELFAFLGTNGAGKSTTINMICSLLTKTSGKIIVSGFDMDCEAKKIRSCLGIVFQNNVLDDLLTVKENLTIRAQLRGLCGVELNTCIKELKENFDLFDIWKRPFGKLSGGQKRKCEIAQAVLHKPEILILDEVLSVGDMFFRKKSEKRIKEMIKSGSTVLIVSHSTSVIRANCTKAVWIEKGKLKAVGKPEDVCRAYEKMNG